MRESQIEAHLVKRVKALGGEVRKVQWIGRRGAPDRIVMMPRVEGLQESAIPALRGTMIWSCIRQGWMCWVELKRPGEKPTSLQLREHERMRAMGQTVVVIDSIEGVDDLLA